MKSSYHTDPGPTPDIERNDALLNVRSFSYGGTAAIVTSMALITGLDAAMANRIALITGLLVIAIADNLTDSLSIHIYQESERLEPRTAFFTTLANYATRLLVSCSFLLLVLLLPAGMLNTAAMIWGLLLLTALTCTLTWNKKAAIPVEIVKHLSVALLAILASRIIGTYIGAHVR